jgi:hypothetical protein
MATAALYVLTRPRTTVRVAGGVAVGLLLALLVLVAVLQGALDTTRAGGGASPASAEALRDIPLDRLVLYQRAAAAYGLDWAILAAVGKVECDHGRSRLRGCYPRGSINSAGARGPMQFLGDTWRSSAGRRDPDVAGPAIPAGEEARGYATDANRDGTADPWQPSDAIFGTARLLRDHGAPGPDGYEAALHAYNPSDDYVASVLDYAERYRADRAAPNTFTGTPGGVPLTDVACPAGGNTTIHAQLAPVLTALYEAASSDGHQLCGGGHRDPERQIELRRQNCGASQYAIYEMPSSQCSPPTARPGNSMHERGLAIDFTCGGALIRSRDNPCYGWLADHADDYGLHNLPSEPWHFSTTGD